MNSSKAIAGGLAGAVSILLIWAAVIVGYAIVYFAPANTGA